MAQSFGESCQLGAAAPWANLYRIWGIFESVNVFVDSERSFSVFENTL